MSSERKQHEYTSPFKMVRQAHTNSQIARTRGGWTLKSVPTKCSSLAKPLELLRFPQVRGEEWPYVQTNIYPCENVKIF